MASPTGTLMGLTISTRPIEAGVVRTCKDLRHRKVEWLAGAVPVRPGPTPVTPRQPDRWICTGRRRPAVTSLAVTRVPALPAALTDEHPVAAQFAAVGVTQRLLVAAEIEDRREDNQPAAGVDLGAGLAVRRGVSRPRVVHRVAKVFLLRHPAPGELGTGAAAPPDRGAPGVVTLEGPAHREHLAPGP